MALIGIQLNYGIAIASDLALGLLSVLGFVLQRRSHVFEQRKPLNQQRISLLRPLWQLGFWLYVIFGTMASIVTLASLPFFVVVPLGSSRLVYNVIYSHFLLHEDIGFHALLGTLYITIAATVIGIFGNIPEHHHNVDDLISIFRSPHFLAYQISIVVVIIVLSSCVLWHKSMTLRSKGIVYGVLSAIQSSLGGLYAKSGIQLLNLTVFGGQNQFHAPIAYIVVVLMIVLPLLGLYNFNKSLAYTETVVTIPITYCISIVLAVLNTAVYYDYIDSISAYKWVVMSLALVYLMYGVYLLANARIHHATSPGTTPTPSSTSPTLSRHSVYMDV